MKKPVWHNQEKIILHVTIKYAISDLSVSLRKHLQSKPTLDSSGQKSLILWRQIRGYQTLDPTTKHPKATPDKLVLHIYNKTNTHLNTAIIQLIAGAFFFGMQSCKYSTTPKGDVKRTCILQKGCIQFYRKLRDLSQDSGILHLENKVSPKFRTKKNGAKSATVTQWKTITNLCPVRI